MMNVISLHSCTCKFDQYFLIERGLLLSHFYPYHTCTHLSLVLEIFSDDHNIMVHSKFKCIKEAWWHINVNFFIEILLDPLSGKMIDVKF